jgi:hypothetical protein
LRNVFVARLRDHFVSFHSRTLNEEEEEQVEEELKKNNNNKVTHHAVRGQKKVTDFGDPRACRFRKHQMKNRFPEIRLATFFKT